MNHARQVALCGDRARRYAAMGLNPLPSRPYEKRPALPRYRQYLTEPIPRRWLDDWRWANLQIPCGVRWGIAVLDIDGPEAMRQWISWCGSLASWDVGSGCPWSSAAPVMRDGQEDFSGRRHLWFTIPAGMESCPTTVLWSRDEARKGHPEIKVIGDGGLVVAPPSVHPERKTQYQWLDHRNSPENGPPCRLPGWLLERVSESRRRVPAAPPPPASCPRREPKSLGYSHGEVLAALGDGKLAIAEAHGLRVAGPTRSRFVRCHAADRPDETPSCSLDRTTGRYFDWALNTSCSFFDLLCLLDPSSFPTWRSACDRLGLEYLGVVPCPRRTSSSTSSSCPRNPPA